MNYRRRIRLAEAGASVHAPPGMLILSGPPAFTSARLARRLQRLQRDNAGVSAVSARFVHFIDTGADTLSDKTRRVLEQLLKYGPRIVMEDVAGRELLVVPRLGTISPWSSKATDIAHNCGLSTVRRIERGTAFHIEGAKAEPAPFLHDRMTQAVLRTFDEAARLFQHVPPRPLQYVPVSGIKKANVTLGLALSED